MSRFEFRLGIAAALLAILLAALGSFTANAAGPMGGVFGKGAQGFSQSGAGGSRRSD